MRVTHKDRELLALLRDHGRASHTDLAKMLGVSRTTLQKRLDRLETEGVITGYTVRIASQYLDQEIKAHVSVTVNPSETTSIITTMQTMESVRAIYSVSGPYDLIVEIAALTVRNLDTVIDDIIAIEGVERTLSSVILSTRLKR